MSCIFISFLQCAESGVIYLESMLSIRSPLVLDDHKNVNIKDADMVHLLQEGLFTFLETLFFIL